MSSNVENFATNRKRVGLCDFLLVDRCDYGLTLHRFWDTAPYWLKIACFSYSSHFSSRAPSVPFGISGWS